MNPFTKGGTMSRSADPYIISRRGDSDTYQVTLNASSGLPERVRAEWKRRSFKKLPDELAQYRYPMTKPDAKAAAVALISFLKNKQEEGSASPLRI